MHGGDGSATAHDWVRTIGGLEHAVRLLPPVYVKSFAKRQKNNLADAEADAEATAEAASRPTMRFVAVKTEEQQARSMIFRTRDLCRRCPALKTVRKSHIFLTGPWPCNG